MKTIKVFLASSEELADERQKFGNLIRRLDDIYIKRGIHVQLLVWEDMDPCYNNVRKQDEYNAWICESDIFVCLFYTRAGQYTLEELDVAQQENARRKEPKLMIYCRDLRPDEVEMSDLLEFKQRMEKELGHFWGHYPTTDKLHLDFVMFLMRSEPGLNDALKVENSNVMFDSLPIASVENLPFAAKNAGYQKMKAGLKELSEEIEVMQQDLEKKKQKLAKKKAKLEKNPDDEDCQEDYQEAQEEIDWLNHQLQPKLDKKNALKEEFASYKNNLFDTAKRISEMQMETVSSELQRAIHEFETGHVEAANTILDGIEREAVQHLEQLNRDRMLVHQDIDALQLKTKTLMDVTRFSIEERIQQTWDTYKKAVEWSELSAFPKEKYATLLRECGLFLFKYAKYDEALKIWLHESRMNVELYGGENLVTARSYNNIGEVYRTQGDYDLALMYYMKACEIRKKVLGTDHPDTAQSYLNIGNAYLMKDECDRALEYCLKALKTQEKTLGKMHLDTAMSYGSIGTVYYEKGEYYKALECNIKACKIRAKVLGEEHPLTASSYNNIGLIYTDNYDYDQALTYHQKACEIYEKALGRNHPDTAMSYNNIGMVFSEKGDYNRALVYFQKALEVFSKRLGEDHPNTKKVRNSIKKEMEKNGEENMERVINCKYLYS